VKFCMKINHKYTYRFYISFYVNNYEHGDDAKLRLYRTNLRSRNS